MIKFEGVVFNAEWVASQTLEAFMAHESHHKLSKEKLAEAYRLCVKLTKKQPLKNGN